jgi:hypothetical protein
MLPIAPEAGLRCGRLATMTATRLEPCRTGSRSSAAEALSSKTLTCGRTGQTTVRRRAIALASMEPRAGLSGSSGQCCVTRTSTAGGQVLFCLLNQMCESEQMGMHVVVENWWPQDVHSLAEPRRHLQEPGTLLLEENHVIPDAAEGPATEFLEP